MGQIKIGGDEWQDVSAVELKCHYCDTTNHQDVLTAVWSEKEQGVILVCRNHNPFKEGLTAIFDALTGFPTFIHPGENSIEK